MGKRHPNKHIREAIEFAIKSGWSFVEGRDHCFGMIRCQYGCECQKSVWSTPRVPENHVRELKQYIKRCPKLEK